MTYRLTDNSNVCRVEDGAFIPDDPDNLDRQAYDAWVAEGNTPEPFVPTFTAPVVPASVTNFQARAVLFSLPATDDSANLFEQVNRDLKAAGGLSWQAWEQANEFVRASPLINQLAGDYNISQEEIDSLFIAAALIDA